MKELFLEFLKIGAFAFGGAYGAVPLIREGVLGRGWMDEAQLMDLLAISESTPGPIMVNAATMTGFLQAGIMGAALATLGVILPSFLIMLLVPHIREKWGGRRAVKLAMRGIKPCLAGVICATGIRLGYTLLLPAEGFDPGSLILLSVLAGCMILYQRITKKQLSPILLILLAAVLGMIFF